MAKSVYYIRVYNRRSGYKYKWDCFILNLIVFVIFIFYILY